MSDKKKPTGFPEMDTILSVHAAYCELRDGTADSLSAIAEKLGQKPSSLQRRINRFEQAIRERSPKCQFKLFERGRGQRTKIIATDNAVELMADVAVMVEAYERVNAQKARPLKIRIGAGLTVSSYLMPILLRDPELEDCAKGEVAFEFTPAKPLRLRDMATSGDCDLIVVPVSANFAAAPKQQVAEAKLPLALLAPRGHWTEREKFDWKGLGRDGEAMILLKQEPDRHPMPEYPMDEFPVGLNIHRVSNVSLSHMLVMDGVGVTISLPQFFSQRQREYFHVVQDSALKSMRIAALRGKEDKFGSAAKRRVLKKLEQIIEREMENLTRREVESTHPVVMRMYHVTPADEQLYWVEGELVWRLDDSKHISGIYRLQSALHGREIEFVIHGYMGSPALGRGRHIVCNGVGRNVADEFVLDATCQTGEGIEGDHLGIWAGKPLFGGRYDKTAFQHNVVITKEPIPPKRLCTIAKEYNRQHCLEVRDVPDRMANFGKSTAR